MVEPVKNEVLLEAMSFIKDMAHERLAELHGKKSIDWVLGFQACANHMVELAEMMIADIKEDME